jgi:hypothetical protein
MIRPVNTNINYHASVKTEQLEEIKASRQETQQKQFAQIISQIQSTVVQKSEENRVEVNAQAFKDFLKDIGYTGKPIASLSKEEATALVSEDGFFGITQTSERIAQFVIAGAGGDENLLREGRKGVLQGFKEAEAIWGGKLPDISYETIEKAVAMIDKALTDNGYAVLDAKV